MKRNKDCLFCKIIERKLPGHIVHEEDDILSFLDINQSAPGHSMVVHKSHGKSILDYNEEELGRVMTGVQKVAKKLQESLSCDWISIGINHLEKRGVPHLHVHLIPRWEHDKGGVMQSLVSNPPEEKLEEIAKKIRKIDI